MLSVASGRRSMVNCSCSMTMSLRPHGSVTTSPHQRGPILARAVETMNSPTSPAMKPAVMAEFERTAWTLRHEVVLVRWLVLRARHAGRSSAWAKFVGCRCRGRATEENLHARPDTDDDREDAQHHAERLEDHGNSGHDQAEDVAAPPAQHP